MRTQHFPTKIVNLLCLGLLILSACTPQAQPSPFYEWQFTDVKVLDDDIPSHSDQESSPDLLALYLRESDQDLQLRLDFFDLAQIPDFDLYLAFDTTSGGIEIPTSPQASFAWDLLVRLPATGSIQVFNSQNKPFPDARVQLFRDPILDQLLVSISQEALAPGLPSFKILSWLTAPGSEQIIDSLPVAHSNKHIAQPVNLLMAFSDSFPAYTPAQALRRWDGAHTGPSGGRHGLVNLLRITENFNVPVLLLDLMNPASLSAMDYLGGLETIRSMQASGQLILPLYAPYLSPGETGVDAQLLDIQAMLNQEYTQAFALRQTQLLYSPTCLAPQNSRAKVIFLGPDCNSQPFADFQTIQPARWKDKILLNLPANPTTQEASLEGPSEVLKKTITNAMLEGQAQSRGDSFKILVLGGELPASTWGNPQAIRPTLRYLSSRPWLHFLGEHDLLSLQTSESAVQLQQTQTTSATHSDRLWQAIESAPNNNLALAARQAFLSASNPVFPQPAELPLLRNIYQMQTWQILAAADWAESPQTIASCGSDRDLDGQLECILASDNLYAVIQPSTGTLTHLFARLVDPISQLESFHQVIGPSAQLISGLSEASTWKLTEGYQADPAVIQGAFNQPASNYSTAVQAGSILLTSADGLSRMEFSLFQNSLQVAYRSDSAAFTQLAIPLLLDPWERFTPGWWQAYQAECVPGQCAVQSASGIQVLVKAEHPLLPSHFMQTQDWMSSTENPNREQPAGHFLPFPLVVLEIPPVHSFEVRIEVISNP